MAVLSKQYTFVAQTKIKAAEVNTNFDQIVDFVNNNMVQRDGTQAFTGWPSFPGDLMPPADANPATKKYVDSKVTGGLYTGPTFGGAVVITHNLHGAPQSAVAIPNTATTSAGGDRVNISVISGDSTTITFKLTDSSTGGPITGNVRFNWFAYCS